VYVLVLIIQTYLHFITLVCQHRLSDNATWLRQTCCPQGLRCSSAAISFLGSQVQTPLSAWLFVFLLFFVV